MHISTLQKRKFKKIAVTSFLIGMLVGLIFPAIIVALYYVMKNDTKSMPGKPKGEFKRYVNNLARENSKNNQAEESHDDNVHYLFDEVRK